MELFHSSSIFSRGYFSFSLGICLPQFRPFIFFVSLNSVAGPPLFSIRSLPLGEISFSLTVSITIRADVSHVFAFSTVLFCAFSFNHYFCFHFPHFSNLFCIVLRCIFSKIFFSFLTYSLCFDILAIGIKFLTCLLVVMML